MGYKYIINYMSGNQAVHTFTSNSFFFTYLAWFFGTTEREYHWKTLEKR